MAQAASFFSAGFDTSATPMAFALYELALHPEIQSRLRRDILETLENANGNVTYNMVSHMILVKRIRSNICEYYSNIIVNAITSNRVLL